MSNDKKKFQKLSDDATEKAAGGTKEVKVARHPEDGFKNLNPLGINPHYDVTVIEEDGSKIIYTNQNKWQTRGIINERGIGYSYEGKDPFSGEED